MEIELELKVELELDIMKFKEILCKSALSPSGIYGWKYALNPYRGCEHSCIYCYAPNILRIKRETWGEFVEIKKNIPTILAKELKTIQPGLVGLSSVTDPYQKAEEKYKLTRYCIEQLLRYKFPVSIITKSPLILRDIDLLKEISNLEITITITTMDEQLSNLLEPEAPIIKERLEALAQLSAEKLNTYAFLGPLLPTLEFDQVHELINTIATTGVHTIMVDSLNLKPGIWPKVANTLDDLPEIKQAFYNRLFKDKNYYPEIFQLIKNECKHQNMKFDG